MNLYDVAIRRPVFTVMMMVALVIFGIFGYSALPMNLLPSLEFPNVTVTTILPGASPEVMETDVTDVIESAVNTIEGIQHLTSYSGQGVSRINITFDLGRDVDLAAQDVRDKVAGAQGQLPLDVEPPVVQKLDINTNPWLWIALSGSDQRTLSEYADTVLRPRLQSLPGVGNVVLGGFRERMIRVWIDPDKLAAYHLSVNDVVAALGRENLELPGGLLEGERREIAVRNLGLFQSIDDFDQMIIAHVRGAPVRLADVGFAEDGIEDERGVARYNLEPTIGIGIAPRSGGNMVEISRRVRGRMVELAEEFPPGFSYAVVFDAADFVESSIVNVQVDILWGALLATLVVFAFLRSWRSTMIVALAIPTSLVTTFGFMRAFGFSLNNLTTLALALSVGVVIDDAIVVLENIFRHQEEGEKPMAAALNGTREIALAAMAATFSIAAVFIPVAYTKGMVGRFLFEFGVSVAAAILVSLFVALTLTPMLSSRFLRHRTKHGALYRLLEGGFRRLERGYSRALDWSLRHKALTLLATVALLVASLLLIPLMGAELAPQEDMSMFLISMEAPVGISLPAMDLKLREVERIVLSQPEALSLFAAIGIQENNQVNTGVAFIIIVKPDFRTATQKQVIARLRREFAQLDGISVRPSEFSFYNVSGGEEESWDFSYLISGPDLETLDQVGRRVMARLGEIDGFVDLDTNLDLAQPQLHLRVDRNRAHDLGLDAASVFSTVYSLVAGREVGSYTHLGKRYDVRLKALPSQVGQAEDLGALPLRTPSGQMVRLEHVVEIRHGTGPININRTDRERSLSLTGNLEGLPLNVALERVRRILDEELPAGYHARPAGQAEEFQKAMAALLVALGLAVVIVYMVLASQFNSFLHPFTIMLALPPAVIGALGALYLTGNTFNIMSMIGLILLFGLVTKNSILLVDFTIRKQNEGLDREAALRAACPIRLRPILMTAVSMIFGVLPVALALGEGSEARAPMAIATAGGMATSTLLTLFVVPSVYALLDRLAAAVVRRTRPSQEHLDA